MMKEWATVVSWQQGVALLRCEPKAGCGSCTARSGCGARALNELVPETEHQLQVHIDQPLEALEPVVLRRERLRPSRVATRDRLITQPQALALQDRHRTAAGLRWWSVYEGVWINVTLFDRAYAIIWPRCSWWCDTTVSNTLRYVVCRPNIVVDLFRSASDNPRMTPRK